MIVCSNFNTALEQTIITILYNNDSDSVEEDSNDSLFQGCVKVGKALNKLIFNDLTDVNNCKLNTIEDVDNFDLRQWLFNRPKELIYLLCSICQIDINTTSSSKMLLISKAMELLYYCMNSKLVLPSHFVENLLCFSLPNCKLEFAWRLVGERAPIQRQSQNSG